MRNRKILILLFPFITSFYSAQNKDTSQLFLEVYLPVSNDLLNINKINAKDFIDIMAVIDAVVEVLSNGEKIITVFTLSDKFHYVKFRLDESDKVLEIDSYTDSDVRNGTHFEFYNNGRIKHTICYGSGVKHGYERFYDLKGYVTTERFYQLGSIIYNNIYFTNSLKLLESSFYLDNQFLCIYSYRKSGKLRLITYFYDDNKVQKVSF